MSVDRFNKEVLIDELKLAGARFKGSSIFCPFHDDKHPSAGIYQSKKDNVWRFKCQSTQCGFIGDIFDVKAKRSGKDVKDIVRNEKYKRPDKPRPPRTYKTIEQIESAIASNIEDRYVYTNPDTGNHDLVVIRHNVNGNKSFKQIHSLGDGYLIGSPPKPWPIYNRTRVRQSNIVVVVEGEKCVHALNKAGCTATTSPAGAGKASYADWESLAGKNVFLWPDNDKSGFQHMVDVKNCLEELNPVPNIFSINPTDIGLGEKEDAADYLENFRGRSKDDLMRVVADAIGTATQDSLSDDLLDFAENIISGQYCDISWPWKSITKLTKALLPGTVTIICGDPGSSKSLFLLEAAAYWFANEVKIAIYELEEDRMFHLYRALTQRVGNSRLFDFNWVKQNPEFIRNSIATNKKFFDSFGKHIYEAPERQVTLEELAEWVERKALAGCRIIAIDPITAAISEDKPWVADNQFLMRVKAIARRSGCSLVFITHPKKGRKQSVGFDELSGGAAYSRFAQSILWIKDYEKIKSVKVSGDMGPYSCSINRAIHICKSRSGIGHRLDIGFMFDSKSLTFNEKGLVLPKDDD